MKTLLALLIACCAMTPLHAEAVFTKRIAIGATGKVSIFNAAGDVTVSSWNQPELAVEAHLDGGVDHLDMSADRGGNTIRVLLKRLTFQSTRAHLVVHVPVNSDVEVVTVSASIVVQGAPHTLQARSISGFIGVEGSAPASRVRVESLGGAVSIKKVAGEVAVEASVGAVGVSMTEASRIDIRATASGIHLEAQLVPDAQVNVRSSGGGVQARLLSEAGYRYDATTYGGSLHTCFGGESAGNSGQVGAGKGSVHIQSFGGAVTLCDR
jgi:hypothetical protein